MNCHFCNQPIPPARGRLQICHNHPHKVIHAFDRWNPVSTSIDTDQWEEPITITIRLPNKLDITWNPHTKTFKVWHDIKLLLELDKFPSQITPENAADEILFYLTFS